MNLLLTRLDLDFLCLNETLLTPLTDDALLYVPGYEFVRLDRSELSGKKSGGGLLIYYKSDRDVIELPELSQCSPHLECLWVRMNLKLAKPTLIGCVYHVPDSRYNDSLNELDLILSQLDDVPRTDLVILGDVNINLNTNNAQTNALNALLKRQNLKQLITGPTHVSEQCSSLFDQVYINNEQLYWHSRVVDPGLSDHSLIYTCRKYHKPSKEKETRFIRDYRKFNPEDFASDVGNIDWHSVYTAVDIDVAVSIFNFEIINIINKHLP